MMKDQNERKTSTVVNNNENSNGTVHLINTHRKTLHEKCCTWIYKQNNINSRINFSIFIFFTFILTYSSVFILNFKIKLFELDYVLMISDFEWIFFVESKTNKWITSYKV